MKILYVEDNKDFRELIAMAIEGQMIHFEIIEATNGEEAIKLLHNDADIKIVISDLDMPDGNGFFLYEEMKKNNFNQPFILFTSHSIEELPTYGFKNLKLNKNFDYISKDLFFNTLVKKLVRTIEERTKITSEISAYSKIKIDHIQHLEKIPYNIYIKINDNKYVKIIKKEDSNSKAIIDKYKKKKVQYFYATADEYQLVLENISAIIMKKLADKNIPLNERVDLEIRAMDFIHDKITELGIDETVIEIMQNIVTSNILTIRKNPNLSTLIGHMMQEKGYKYGHSLMISYIAGAIASKTSWASDATLQKLAIASIMHDITINDSDLIELHDMEPEKIKDLNIKNHDLIIKHPSEGSEIIKQTGTSFPPDVEAIILSHHERIDGTGYPRKLDALHISPLSCIFIMAEDMTTQIYNKNLNEIDIPNLLKKLKEKYNHGNFKKPLKALMTIFNNR